MKMDFSEAKDACFRYKNKSIKWKMMGLYPSLATVFAFFFMVLWGFWPNVSRFELVVVSVNVLI